MTENKAVFITGNSSGIGLALTGEYLARGYQAYGVSRRGCPLQNDALHDAQCDLAEFDAVPPALQSLFGDVTSLDLVALNAGMLGDIHELHATPMADIRRVMDINLCANKAVMDCTTATSVSDRSSSCPRAPRSTATRAGAATRSRRRPST